jgi:DNA repair protein RadC
MRINIKKSMDNYENHIPINKWAEDDRPREKLELKGRHALSDAELLAILIATGTRSESAVDLSKRLLQKASNNLIELSKMCLSDLLKEKGIGRAKAMAIMAALELGRRRNESGAISLEKITQSRQAFEIFRSLMGDVQYEQFWMLLLNRGNRLMRKIPISEGGISGTVVDPKKIFNIVLEFHASSIIIGHNHPSGNLEPSEADTRLTRKIRDAGTLLDIALLDHIIVGDDGYYSFADQGTM